MDGDAFVVAWQVMAGITYENVRLGYRFFQTADIKVSGQEITHATHAIELGVLF